MSFYDELADEYKADVDPETGLSGSNRKTLDLIICRLKNNIRESFRKGILHTVVHYDNFLRNSPALVHHTLECAEICEVLSGCLYDEKYAKAHRLLRDSIGTEFNIYIDHVSKGMYSDEFTIKITWEAPEIEETT